MKYANYDSSVYTGHHPEIRDQYDIHLVSKPEISQIVNIMKISIIR